MGWENCKTDWKTTDCLEAADYNRIRANQLELGALAAELYGTVTMPPGEAVTYATSETAAAVNVLERGLDALLDAGVYNPGLAPRRTWTANGLAPTAADVNRWEHGAQLLHDTLASQAALRPTLAYTLNGGFKDGLESL